MTIGFRGTGGPIRTEKKLAEALQLDLDYLIEVSQRPASENYRRVIAHSKMDGSERIVYSPSRDVRKAQRALANRVFKDPAIVRWPVFVFGGIPNKALVQGDLPRDYVSCAGVHARARSLIKLDVRNFFDNIGEDLVRDVFSGLLGWRAEPASLATRLCTREGTLPQGGITSSYLALLCLHRDEVRVFRALERKGLKYTRYVDDITVSSQSVNREYDYALKLVDQMLLKRGLVINQSKIKIQKSGTSPLEVHNLRVGFGAPRLPQREIKRIKQACRQMELLAKESGRRGYSYRRTFHRATGLVNKMARVGNNQHASQIARLNRIRPLPSYRDYSIAIDVGIELRENYVEKGSGYWYRRRFYVLMERLNLIAVEDPGWAKTLRDYMRHFRPREDDV